MIGEGTDAVWVTTGHSCPYCVTIPQVNPVILTTIWQVPVGKEISYFRDGIPLIPSSDSSIVVIFFCIYVEDQLLNLISPFFYKQNAA